MSWGLGADAGPMMRPWCNWAAKAGDGVCRGWDGSGCGSLLGWLSRNLRLSTKVGSGSCCGACVAAEACILGVELLLLPVAALVGLYGCWGGG